MIIIIIKYEVVVLMCRVCVVCVAPTHPVIKKKAEDKVVNIEFQIGGLDRASNSVSGKYKNKYNYNIYNVVIYDYCTRWSKIVTNIAPLFCSL